MEVTFTNANPGDTGESFLIRFDGGDDPAACFLVDSGAGVDVDSLLDDGDRLAGIFLTHAHIDHYRTLPENHRPEVPVYVSPDTERLLPPVLRSNADLLDLHGDVEPVLNHVRAIGDEWVRIAPAVEVRPVPTGHAPGACGFVVRFDDGVAHHMLITGDFTRRAVAGNPGISLGYPADIEAVFFNSASASHDGTDALTDSLNDVIEGVLSGGPTLVATDALVGVQYAHLIAEINAKRSLDATITLAGQTATLHERLDRDRGSIRTVPEFDATDDVFDGTDVCIAGPSTLSGASSQRLHNAIKDDPTARTIAIGNIERKRDDPKGVDRYPHVSHPSRERAEEVIEALFPKETIIEHGNFARYGTVFDFSYTWSCNRDVPHRLYGDGEWHPPGWVGRSTCRTVESRQYGDPSPPVAVSDDERADDEWPSVETTVTNVAAEGVDTDDLPGGRRDGRASPTKYSTDNCEGGDSGAEATDTSGRFRTATADGGAVASSASATAAQSEGVSDDPDTRVERERLARAAEVFLDRVRPDEGDGECEFAHATVSVTDAGDYLLRIDGDSLDMELEDQESVTASIHTD